VPLFDTLALLDDPAPHSAALNMAIDEVLLRTASTSLLRCYRWASPSVSFGYFGRFAEVEAEWPERDLVRRWTGGGIVPHGEDFTYSIIVPRGHSFAALRTAASYLAIHRAIAEVLRRSGRAVALAEGSAQAVSSSCFANPVQHDLILARAKVAGAAQRRTQRGLLHQGSVQLPSLPPNFGEMLAAVLSANIAPGAMTRETAGAATVLAGEKYGTQDWLCRA
jgi:lipoate-protein ligase A